MRDGVWRMIRGRRVFIRNGQSLTDAMRESGKFNQQQKEFTLSEKKNLEIDNFIGTIELTDKEYIACNEVLKKFKDNKSENLLLIDKDNFETKGKIATSNEYASVGFSDEQIKIMQNVNERSLIAVHNHPGNGTFSVQDIYTCIQYDKIGGIMVVTDNYIYSLNPNFSKNNIVLNEKGYSIGFENKIGEKNDELLSKYPMYSNNQLQHVAFKEIFEEMGIWKNQKKKRLMDLMIEIWMNN